MCHEGAYYWSINPLSANPTKWSKTLKQFVAKCRRMSIPITKKPVPLVPNLSFLLAELHINVSLIDMKKHFIKGKRLPYNTNIFVETSLIYFLKEMLIFIIKNLVSWVPNLSLSAKLGIIKVSLIDLKKHTINETKQARLVKKF